MLHAMTDLGPWRTEDFDSLSWHDVHVHGLRFASFNEDEGTTDLVLDIDYILKWEQSVDQVLFTICRADLTFHRAFGLKLELDYRTPGAGMCPFSLDGIRREPLEVSAEFRSFRWRLDINWPRGHLELEAPEFTQTLTGKPVVKADAQSLSTEERASAV